jgi:hypothetical protein
MFRIVALILQSGFATVVEEFKLIDKVFLLL